MILTQPDLQHTLTVVIERLRETFSPLAIYLHGSYAHGTPRSHSDLDLVVVVADSPMTPYERDAQAYLALLDVEMPIDVQVYTRSEFEERASLTVSFERTVKLKGKLLYAA
jgi:predicted nucleotidyltransferase